MTCHSGTIYDCDHTLIPPPLSSQTEQMQLPPLRENISGGQG